MAYTCKYTQDNYTPNFSVILRLDIANHRCLQVLDIVLGNEQWRVINFYHDIRDKTSLAALLALDIEATTPTLVIGDFNTHSPSWSPPDVTRSAWAGRLEEWAASNLLQLANTPGEITRQGANHEKSSTINLAWYNGAAIQNGTFSDLRIDWDDSLGSNHACLFVLGTFGDNGPPPPEGEQDLGFVVDPERREEWTQAFRAQPAGLPFSQTPTEEDVEAAVEALTEAIHQANSQTFRRRRPHHPKASPWWNAACADAVQGLRNAQGTPEKARAQARLKGTIRAAKRLWADDYIEKSQLWEVAVWRHGRRTSKVPSLRGPEGLAHTHGEISTILSQRFFADAPPQVDLHFEDDPPARPTRQLQPVDKNMIDQLLSKASNRSAPRRSGHTWTIIKWA
jgi:hypothetical protein